MMKLKKNMLYLLTIFLCYVVLCFGSVVEESYAEENDIATQTDGTETEDENIIFNGYNLSYIDDGERVGFYTPTEYSPNTYGVLPASYDARNQSDTGTYSHVTSVKNQNPYGTCWAFSAIGALESSMLAQGYVTDSSAIDLSEYHFAYFFYHHALDPLQGLKNDTTTAVGDSWLNRGSNSYFSMFSLASWRGGADESIAPYGDIISETSALDTSLAFQNSVHMQNARVVSMKNTDDVKKLIMENGSVVSSVYMCSQGYGYDTDSYYQTQSSTSNHAIMVIGWDDNYSVDNFATSPSAPGAWLIKNSWGADYIPYLWVSYEDLCLSTQDAFAFFAEPATNYDFNYQYDGCETSSYQFINNGDWIANVFTVSGASMESLEAVSIALADDNIAYSIQIYLNPEDGNPVSGTPMLDEPVTGMTDYVGYYTIPLNESILLQSGDRFSVVFTLEDMDVINGTQDAGTNCYVDSTLYGNWIRFESYTEPGLSYYYNSYNDQIYDFYERYSLNCCARIKAFTCETYTVDVSGFDIDELEDCISIKALYEDPRDEDLEFQWKIYNLQTQKWELLQGWSTDDFVSWKPGKGNYWIRVEVKTEQGEESSYTEVYVSEINYSETYIQINDINLQYNENSITATVDVKSNADTEYRWLVYDLQTQQWILLSDWNAKKAVVWKPTKGTYWLCVEAKTEDGCIESYTKAYTLDRDYCSYVTLSAYCTVKRDDGIAVGVVYASNSDSVMFQWKAYNLDEKKWEMVSGWSNGNWITWKPKQGNYWLRVEAKTSDGATADYTQVFTVDVDYTKTYITLSQYCVLNRTNDIAVGVVYSTNADDIQFRWLAYNTATKQWQLLYDWSSGNWMSWKPKQGTYWLRVEAKSGSDVTADYTVVIDIDKSY